ncbi:MAG: hypothetical protein ACI8X5_002361 [Planctomycetota bacterium]|jgi:hypothetical protein
MNASHLVLLALSLSLASCESAPQRAQEIHVAHLASGDGFPHLREAFAKANLGYDVNWHPDCQSLSPVDRSRILFVQGPADRSDEPTVGDILLLAAGESWQAPDGMGIDLLCFDVPLDLHGELPHSIRPDWDPKITDTPGGCAEEIGAYRRILLTWLEEKGPYVLHALNAHRVRINDSFSHYHPLDGGFDEFYLVQMAGPGAQLLTSTRVPLIEQRKVSREQAASLIQTRKLQVGDLVYLPRGTMHRGLGGPLVQVISVPGFVPNSEIGLDHHLRALNEQLELKGDRALPFQRSASKAAVLK